MPMQVEAQTARDGFAITASDTVNFAQPANAIYVGTGGTVVVVTPNGSVLTFAGCADGSIIPIRAIRVNSTTPTNTTASNLIGLVF